MSVSALDCTGCGSCVNVCPGKKGAKALAMENLEASADEQKYFDYTVKENLDRKGFMLKSVQSCQYDDKYLIETPSGTVIVDCYYNGSGLYTRYVPQCLLPENEDIIDAFENDSNMQYSIDYNPSSEAFSVLYKKILSVCDDMDITITNIVEHLPQYYISYYFKTSGKNPQQLLIGILQNQAQQNPMYKDFLYLIQNNRANEIEPIVRANFQKNGLDFDKEFNSFKKTLGL